MKVLMFGWEFPPHISGGLGTACRGLTKALAGLEDVSVTFVVPRLWGDEDKAMISLLGANEVPVISKQIQFTDTESKIEYYELHSELVPYLGSSEYYELKSGNESGEMRLIETTSEGKIMFTGEYGKNLFQEIESFAVVAEKLAGELDFDIIHVHDWMTFNAGIAAKNISGKPLVVHTHSTEFDRSGDFINPLIYELEKKGMEAADRVIAVSNYTREVIIENYFINPEKVTTVYNAVEPFEIKTIKSIRKSDKEKIVLFLGRITSQKGPVYFVEAARLILQEMKNIRFIMAGKGDLRDKMIKHADELNILDRFEFPGFIEDDEVVDYLSSADVFVMPSVSEPFGIVVLEAMQAGAPVVISKQSGASEILENVIKVDYWNVRQMADSILKLLRDSRLKNGMVRKGKNEVSKLLWEKSAIVVRQIYRSIEK